MALAQFMNRNTKNKGGIIGFSQDYRAMEKWAVTAHLRAAVNSNFKDQEKKLAMKATKESETDVLSIMKAINEFESLPLRLK